MNANEFTQVIDFWVERDGNGGTQNKFVTNVQIPRSAIIIRSMTLILESFTSTNNCILQVGTSFNKNLFLVPTAANQLVNTIPIVDTNPRTMDDTLSVIVSMSNNSLTAGYLRCYITYFFPTQTFPNGVYTPPMSIQKNFRAGFVLDIVPGAQKINFFKVTGKIKLFGFLMFNTDITSTANANIISKLIIRDSTAANDLNLTGNTSPSLSQTITGYLIGHMMVFSTVANPATFSLQPGNEVNPNAVIFNFFQGGVSGSYVISANPAQDSFVALSVTTNTSVSNQTNKYDVYVWWEAISADGMLTML